MFIVEDTNFLISLLKSKDIFHDDAVSTLNILSSEDITYIYPTVVLQEAIFVLLRNGYSANVIRKRIMETHIFLFKVNTEQELKPLDEDVKEVG